MMCTSARMGWHTLSFMSTSCIRGSEQIPVCGFPQVYQSVQRTNPEGEGEKKKQQVRETYLLSPELYSQVRGALRCQKPVVVVSI